MTRTRATSTRVASDSQLSHDRRVQVEARPEWLPNVPLRGDGPAARSFRVLGARWFVEAARLVHELPYGRPSRPDAVLAERRGTCSGRHALLSALASELDLDVTLVEVETELGPDCGPEVGGVLAAADLPPLPELHVHLRCVDRGVDLTFPPAARRAIWPPKGPTRTIDASELSTKAARHRERLGAYCAERGLDPTKAWAAREACIAALSETEVEQRLVPPSATSALRQAVLRPHQSLESLAKSDEPNGHHLLRREGGATVAVGSVRAEPRVDGPGGGWRIRGMATAEAARGRGHGQEVLRGLMALAAERGAKELWCNARVGAAPFYEREGFERASERFELPNIGPHYLMVRAV